MGTSYRPDNPFAKQEKQYSPDNPFAKPSAGEQVVGALEQVGNVFRHPIDATLAIGKGIVNSAFDAFFTPVVGERSSGIGGRGGRAETPAGPITESTPGAINPGKAAIAAVNTAANVALPGVGGAVTNRLVNAGLGAINDPEQPIRGATTGLLLGEVIHQGVKRLGAKPVVEEPVPAPVEPSAPRLERRQAERPADARVWTTEERANYITERQKAFAAKVNKPWGEWTPEEKQAYFADQASVKSELAQPGQSFDDFEKSVEEVTPPAAPKTKGGRRKPVEGAVSPKYRLDSDEALVGRAAELLTRIEEYSSGEHGAPVFVRDAADLSKPISGQTSVAQRMAQDKSLFDEVRKELADRGWPEADLNDAINEKWLNTGTEYRHAGLPPISAEAKAVAKGAIAQVAGKPFADLAQSIPDPVTRKAYEKVGGSIDFGERQAKAIAKADKPTLFTRIQNIADQISNGLGPIERLGARVENVLRPSKNPRELLSYAKSSEHTVKKAFDTGVIDPVSRKVVGPSYRSLFEPFAGDDAKIRMALIYLKAKRDVGRGLEGVGGDQAMLDATREVVRHSETDPQMVQFANRWNRYIDSLGNYAVGSGLWTDSFFNALKESDVLYMPYKRVLGSSVRSGNGGAMTAGGDRYVNIGHGVKRFFGSKQAISNPAESLAEYTAAIIRRADSYRVGAALFDAVKELGPEGEWILTPIKGGADRSARAAAAAQRAKAAGVPTEVMQELIEAFESKPDGRNPVIWRNTESGKKEYALVNSPTLWRSVSHLNALEASAVRDFLNITLRPLKRVFTAATTGLVPRFSLATNPVRDIVDAAAKSRAGITPKDVALGYYESLKDIFSRSATSAEAEASGMGGVSMFFGEASPKSVARRFAPTTPLDRVISAAHFTATRPLRALEVLGEASDKGPRNAEYMAFLRKNQHKVDSGEWTEADLHLGAATAGRGVTLDFSNRPGNHVLRFFGDYIPFFNVGLQAPIQFGIAAYRNPRRLIGASAGVASAAALGWAIKHALGPDVQQEINDRQSTERAGFLLVPIDYVGNAIRVPLGQEMGIIASAVTAGLDAAFESDPHAGRLLAASLLRALPPGIAEAVQANPTIPIPGVQQALENAKNRRDYGGHPIVPKRMEDLPPAERRYETTNPTFDLVAAGARAVGFDNFSPLEAENLVRGVTSQATPFITAAVDPWAEKLMGRGAQARLKPSFLQQPLNPASALVARNPSPSTETEQDYYALKTKVAQAETFLSQAAKSGQVSAIPRLESYKAYLNPDLAAGIEVTDQVLKDLRDKETVVREMFQSKELSPDRARTALEELRSERQLVYRRAMKLLGEMVR